MNWKLLVISLLSGICLAIVFCKFNGCCFKEHEPVVIDSLETASLKEKIRNDLIAIDFLRNKVDSLEIAKQKTITVFKNEVKRVKSASEITAYLEKELGDTNSVEIITIRNDSFLKIDYSYGQKIYNTFFECLSYKNLYAMTEQQLKFQDSALIICLDDVDSLMMSFLTVEQQNNLFRVENKTLRDDLEKKDRKNQQKNKVIWIMSGVDVVAAIIIYSILRFQ
jgi:hypothetical protein